jgi:hypothetical protein
MPQAAFIYFDYSGNCALFMLFVPLGAGDARTLGGEVKFWELVNEMHGH